MRQLDKLKINKEEMHHPYKHIVVNKRDEAALLDFERCHHSEKPHNATQFSMFLISGYLGDILKDKKIKINKKKIIDLCKKYKKDQSKKNFEAIKNEIR